MSPIYRYVLEESAFEAFVQMHEEEQQLAHSFMRWLAAHPQDKGRGFHTDTTGRPNYASLCGPFLFVHWTDHATREVRIISLSRD